MQEVKIVEELICTYFSEEQFILSIKWNMFSW